MDQSYYPEVDPLVKVKNLDTKLYSCATLTHALNPKSAGLFPGVTPPSRV